MYEGETLSYDPAIYGGAFEARARIKTLKVCAGALSLYARHGSGTLDTFGLREVWGSGMRVLRRNP